MPPLRAAKPVRADRGQPPLSRDERQLREPVGAERARQQVGVQRPDEAEMLGMMRRLVQARDDEQIDLVALLRLGRGDVTPQEWRDLRAEVTRNYNRATTVRYLLGQPMLGDFLEEGLEELGLPNAGTGRTGRLS